MQYRPEIEALSEPLELHDGLRAVLEISYLRSNRRIANSRPRLRLQRYQQGAASAS